MYLRILKKDLRRKKTMNIILLLFIILATTFVASSVNNIITVVTALDYYFEKAGMSDYFVTTRDTADSTPITEILDDMEAIDSYGVEKILYASASNLIYKGEELSELTNTSVIHALEDAEIKLFDEDNQAIESIEPGQVYVAAKNNLTEKMEIGSTLEIRFGDISESFEVAGFFKDAALGSNMMGMTRFVISENDFEKYAVNEEIMTLYNGSICYINTDSITEVHEVLNSQDGGNIIFNDDIDMIKMSYVMDMVIAGVLLVVSICLILVAFVVLKFTITFTLSEEYREIGVMKAIGIRNVKIRSLYMVKYFLLAVVGAVVGFFASIPFGHMMLKSVSQSLVMETDNGFIINTICSVMVVVIILLFCFSCTGKVKQFTPVDAIRNGTTGERFRKKGMLRMNRSPLKPAVFLAINDVLSSPRRFGTVIFTFTICLSLVLILVNSVNTLKSDRLITTFGLVESDVYLADDGKQMGFMVEGGRALVEREHDEMERILAENGMPAECSSEVMFKFTLMHGDNACKPSIQQGIGTSADQYVYFEGTPPQNAQEIAVTKLVAEELDAEIGDTVIIKQAEGEKECIITALFQNMNYMGKGARLHETAEADLLQTNGFYAFQINFTDDPDEAEIERRIQKMKEIYDTDWVYDAGQYVDRMTGVSSILDSVRMLVLAVVLIIIMLVTVLMERSFISKERGEIAILKAIGFRNSKIVKWHTIRFGIVSILSTLISLIFLIPLTKLSVGPVFRMMGADFGIEYKIVPLEVYVIYPLLVLAVTMISAFLTSLHVRSIHASECTNIE